MYEILTRWEGPNMPNGMVTVMNFDEFTPPEGYREDLETFWTAVGARIHSSFRWTVEPVGRIFNEATGQTTGIWADPRVKTGVGTGTSGGQVANATMVLFQWRTGVYKNGRELRGRTYVPGLLSNQVVGGELQPSSATALATAAQEFVDASPGFHIWSRPKNGTSGSSEQVVSGTVWNELAVLRSRRA